jgi:hypothetical protein
MHQRCEQTLSQRTHSNVLARLPTDGWFIEQPFLHVSPSGEAKAQMQVTYRSRSLSPMRSLDNKTDLADSYPTSELVPPPRVNADFMQYHFGNAE